MCASHLAVKSIAVAVWLSRTLGTARGGEGGGCQQNYYEKGGGPTLEKFGNYWCTENYNRAQ